MPNYQEAKITFNDEKGHPLGVLKLRARYSGPHQGNFSKDSIKCENVPQISKPTNIFPIEYCTLNPCRGLSRIMLIEETNYDVVFESDGKKTIDSFLPLLKKDVFKKNLFNVSPDSQVGIVNFRSYVGRTYLSVEVEGVPSLPIDIEVRSKKIGYVDEYACMMADLSEDCSALIYDLRSPVHQTFQLVNIQRKTFYEDYLFIEYLFKDDNLPAAYFRIKDSPKTQLIRERELVPVGQVMEMDSEGLMDIVCMSQYLTKVSNPPSRWPAAMGNYVPLEALETQYAETLDTPENRFVKFMLEQIRDLIIKLKNSYGYEGYIKDRLHYFHEEITDFLNEGWLEDVSQLTSIPMNSQTLQKMAGYRDIYLFYLNFEFAFKFKWDDVEDSLKASEKRMSQLYEYWCFFRLLNAIKKIAKIKAGGNELVEFTNEGWEIKLKRGKKSKILFNIEEETTKDLTIELYYNRGFSRRGKPGSRSYSLPFRPDYTVLLKSPDQEYPAYIHFDAKYRSEKELEDFTFHEAHQEGVSEADDLSDEELKQVEAVEGEETQRKYKNADIYKMHTYKDAIFNSSGAYVFYPGEREGIFRVDDEYEIPSIGAFPIKPAGDYGEFNAKIEKLIKSFVKSKKIFN